MEGRSVRLSETDYKKLPPHLQALFFKLPNPGSDEVLEAFARFGQSTSTGGGRKNGDKFGGGYAPPGVDTIGFGDTGTAARFFYCGKATKEERGDGNGHPTVKPLSLMKWLCRLITPPGGTVLDPFLGSGSTALAADQEGFHCVGVEQSLDYLEIARRRIAGDAPLFSIAV